MRAQKFKSISRLMACLCLIFYVISNMIPGNHPEKKRSNLEEEVGAERPEGLQVQYISKCLCSRKWMYPPTLDSNGSSQSNKTASSFERLNSSCSDEGTHYRTGQNVITFSMFFPQESKKAIPGSSQTSNSRFFYQIGLLQNLLKMREHYPGYSFRVYTSVPLHPRGYFCDLLCGSGDLFWCDIRKTPGHGDLSRMNFRTWRFLALGDPTVNIFHSRDLDSVISHREAAAVQDWISHNSGEGHKAIVVMRDRKVGHNVPMLAGMWGADNSKLLGEADKLQKRMIWMSQLSSSQEKFFDQKFLKNFIFFPMAKNILAYDSYNCVEWSNFTEVRPFPVQRGNPTTDFVGNRVRFSEDGRKWTYTKVECPLECRPSYGRDWIYC